MDYGNQKMNDNHQAYIQAGKARDYIQSDEGQSRIEEILENSRTTTRRLQKARQVPWERLHQPTI